MITILALLAEVTTTGADAVQAYLDSARARNTIRGYRSSFQQFAIWCQAHNLAPLPASNEAIALYLASNAGRLKAATLQHHLAAIAKAHKTAGFPSPVKDDQLIAETLKGIKRTHGSAQMQKAPVLTEDLRMMLRMLPRGMQGTRDRALLLIGFAGAFRRSELVGLDVSDLAFTPEGLLITLRRSKTDQDGEGRQVAIPPGTNLQTCPVRALQAWLEAAGHSEGPVFRPVRKGGRVRPMPMTGEAVAIIVKRYAAAAGLDPVLFSGHSLRAGFVTSAARAGEPERRIMRQTGHCSVEMVLKYVRHANAFTDNSSPSTWVVANSIQIHSISRTKVRSFMLRTILGIAALSAVIGSADTLTSPDQIPNATVDSFVGIHNPPETCVPFCLEGYYTPINVGNGVVLTLPPQPEPDPNQHTDVSHEGYDFDGLGNGYGGKEFVGDFTFAKPVSAAGLFLKSALYFEYNGYPFSYIDVTAFDEQGNPLGGARAEGQGYPPEGQENSITGEYFAGVSSDSGNIAYLEVYGGQFGVDFSDLVFSSAPADVVATPEPASFALAGLTLLGIVLSRRYPDSRM